MTDSVSGPYQSPVSLFPLASEGFEIPSVFLADALWLLSTLSPSLPTKILLFASVTAGGFGLWRLCTRSLGIDNGAAIVGGTFFVVNPFVLDRFLAGQLFLTLGIALLPWALPRYLALQQATCWTNVRRSLLWMVGISFVDVHVGAIALLMLVAAVVTGQGRPMIKVLVAVAAIACLVAAHGFWIVPSLMAGGGASGSGDLAVYAPRPRSPAILPHTLLLHGFWRTEFATPLEQTPIQFLAVFVVLLGVGFAGSRHFLRTPAASRTLAALAIAGLIALLLGMGTSFGPTAFLTRFLFEYLPGYAIFREPQKWVGVLALIYAVLIAAGVARITRAVQHRGGRSLVAAIGVLAVAAATPSILWGLGGRVHSSTYPTGWYDVNRVTAQREGNLLLLPWNLYQPLPFADGRTIVNPGPAFFEMPVLVSGDAGFARRDAGEAVDPRDDYISALLARHPRLERFGHLVSLLDVRYVALAHVADAPEYGFLERQADLRPLLSDQSMTLYENLAWRESPVPLVGNEGAEALDALLVDTAAQEGAADHPNLVEDAPRLDGLPGSGALRSAPGWNTLPPARTPTSLGLSCEDGWRFGDEVPACNLTSHTLVQPEGQSRPVWRPSISYQLAGWAITLLVLGFVVLRRGRDSRSSSKFSIS